MITLKTSVLVVILLVSSIAIAGLEEDILGTWTFPGGEEGMVVVATLNADGTYKIEIAMGGLLMPFEEGTYTVSGTEVILYSEGQESHSMQDVTVVGDQLSFYDPEEGETVTAVRGVHLPEPVAGTGSISGTISYDGEVSSGITVMALLEQEGDREPVGFAMLTQAGSYTIQGLVPGSYMILAVLGSGEEGVWGVYGISEDLSDIEADPVVVTEGADVKGIDITLYRYGFMIGEEPRAVENSAWGSIKAQF